MPTSLPAFQNLILIAFSNEKNKTAERFNMS